MSDFDSLFFDRLDQSELICDDTFFHIDTLFTFSRGDQGVIGPTVSYEAIFVF